jgi:hypothetical protein
VPDAPTAAAGVKTTDDNGTGECFVVTPLTPTLTTSASCGASPCVLGSTLSDTASLTGTANNPDPANPGTNAAFPTIGGGTIPADSTISWLVYGPGTAGAAQCTTAIGAPTGSPVSVSGDNTSYGPVTYTTNHAGDTVGKYEFSASYAGSGPNTSAATGVSCDTTGGNGEQVTVTGTASSSTAQRWLPNDRVVLSSTAGTILKGSLTVTLYKGAFGGTAANCTVGTGVAVIGQSYTQSVDQTNASPTNSFTYNTTNSTFVVGTNSDGSAGGTDGTYFWLIHFAATGITSPNDRCETSTISHNDG